MCGEPQHPATTTVTTAVYPRVCGGTRLDRRLLRPAPGLSPRVRGNLVRIVRIPDRVRSIPACAGEPKDHTTSAPFSEVYPRVCGGTPANAIT